MRRFATGIVVSVGLTFALGTQARDVRAGSIAEIVAFGDSLTDVGNVFLATGGTNPASPPYYQGRFSNGPIWIEQLAARLGVPDPTPSLAGGTDYAFSGAETHSATGLSTLGTPNLDVQIGMYLQAHPVFDSSQLIVVWGGSNDFLNAQQTDPSIPVANLSQEIATIAAAGGKNFLIPNLAPLGETPDILALGPAASAALDLRASQFNSLLDAAETRLVQTLGINIIRFDLAGVVDAARSNPALYGFTDITHQAKSGPEGSAGAVVPNPDQYLFWDGVHPTAPAHLLIGNTAFAAFELASVPEPPSLLMAGTATLLIGLGSLRRARRKAPPA